LTAWQEPRNPFKEMQKEGICSITQTPNRDRDLVSLTFTVLTLSEMRVGESMQKKTHYIHLVLK
jgi:hypothetical protein